MRRAWNRHHAAIRSIFQCGPATAGSACQSNQSPSKVRLRAALASQMNHAWWVLLGAVGPVQPCRCIIGRRRELFQTRCWRVRAEKRQPRRALQKVRPQQQRQIRNLIERLTSELDREFVRRICNNAGHASRERCGEIIDTELDVVTAVIHQITRDHVEVNGRSGRTIAPFPAAGSHKCRGNLPCSIASKAAVASGGEKYASRPRST